MISASFSLSLPRLGWKSTSMPRSLKICTAAGDSASEMRTLGFVIGVILKRELLMSVESSLVREVARDTISSPSPRSYGERVGVRGSLDRLGLADSPPPSPRKRGEVKKRT